MDDEIRKYEAMGSIVDAVQRFDAGILDGTIDENDDLHGKEIEALRRTLEMQNKQNPFDAMITAYKMGYMRRYDAE